MKKRNKYQAGIDKIAKKLFSFEMKRSPEKFLKLHVFDQDWFRALAEIGRRIVFRLKSDYKFNGKIFPKELFGFDKKRENKPSRSDPVIYNKIKVRGKHESQTSKKNIRKS